MEEVLLDSMYFLPTERKVKDLLITKEMIERKTPVFDIIAPIEEAA
jgi:ATP-dependent protease Clp ATPase subunit